MFSAPCIMLVKSFILFDKDQGLALPQGGLHTPTPIREKNLLSWNDFKGILKKK